MLRNLPRLLLFLALAATAWYFFHRFSQLEAAKSSVEATSEVSTSSSMDQAGEALLFLGSFIVVALIAAIVLCLTILPAIGEIIGGAFYNPGEEVEKSPHHDAMAFLAQGDYQAAVAAYRKVFNDNPADTHALSEAARILVDKLGDPSEAVTLLSDALNRELAPDDCGFIGMRLADLYWSTFGDAENAKAILHQLTEVLAETRHAANAQHKILEIDRALADQSRFETDET